MKSRFHTLAASIAALSLAALTLSTAASAQIIYGAPYGGYRRPSTTRRARTNNANRNRNAAKKASTTTASKKRGPTLTDALNKLNLTPAQRSQIDSYQNKANSDGQTIYNNRALDGQQVIDKMNDVNRGMITNIESVLTPEQKTKLETLYPEAKG